MKLLEQLKQYPLSFAKLEDWCEKKYGTWLVIFLEKIKNEDVVSFLDEQNINIQISVKSAFDGYRWYLPYVWSDSDGCDMDEHLPDRTNRTDATHDAIVKAFEMLETKLKLN